jgi:uncharacterized coiled-coil protein SlyX
MSISFENVDYDLNSLFTLQYSFDTLRALLRGVTDSQKNSQDRIKELERRLGERDTIIKEMNKEILNMSKNFEKRVNVLEVNVKKVKDQTDGIQNDQASLVSNVATLAEKTNNPLNIVLPSTNNANNGNNVGGNNTNNTNTGNNNNGDSKKTNNNAVNNTSSKGFNDIHTEGKNVTEKEVEALKQMTEEDRKKTESNKQQGKDEDAHNPVSFEYKFSMDKFDFGDDLEDHNKDEAGVHMKTESNKSSKIKGDDIKYLMSLLGGDDGEGIKRLIVI